jgi:hypothetical protein
MNLHRKLLPQLTDLIFPIFLVYWSYVKDLGFDLFFSCFSYSNYLFEKMQLTLQVQLQLQITQKQKTKTKTKIEGWFTIRIYNAQIFVSFLSTNFFFNCIKLMRYNSNL